MGVRVKTEEREEVLRERKYLGTVARMVEVTLDAARAESDVMRVKLYG